MFPHLPSSSLTSFLSSLLPPLMSSCHLPSCPVHHLPSFPLIVSAHRVLSCPLVISPCHLLSSSPCLPWHPFTTSPPVSLCPLITSPISPFTSPAVPCCPLARVRDRPPPHPGVSPAAGKGERDPLSCRSGLAAAVAAGGQCQPGAPAQFGDRRQGGPASVLLCAGPTERQRSACPCAKPPTRPVSPCHRVTVPGVCGRRPWQSWEHPPCWEHPSGQRRCPGCAGTGIQSPLHWSEDWVLWQRDVSLLSPGASGAEGRLALPWARAGAARGVCLCRSQPCGAAGAGGRVLGER